MTTTESGYPKTDYEAYIPPMSTEKLYFRGERINATAIDPETGAKLEPIANSVSAELRLTRNGQLCVMSKEGLQLEEELGSEDFARMMQLTSERIIRLVGRLFPPNLIARLASDQPQAFDEMRNHLAQEIPKAKMEEKFSDGSISLLTIGGQSMVVKLSYQPESGKTPIHIVAKTTSPLALSGIESGNIPIICPMTSELLRRALINEDPSFQADGLKYNFGLSEGLVATPYFLLERFKEGREPDGNISSEAEQITRYSVAAIRVMERYAEEPIISEHQKLMGGIYRLDVRVPAKGQPREKWPIKTNNFILGSTGKMICVDPFIPVFSTPRTGAEAPFINGTQLAQIQKIVGGSNGNTIPYIPPFLTSDAILRQRARTVPTELQ